MTRSAPPEPAPSPSCTSPRPRARPATTPSRSAVLHCAALPRNRCANEPLHSADCRLFLCSLFRRGGLRAEPAAAEPSPVSLQTIANAYRDYTRKSFEEFGSFFEQLSGVRSLDKAMEVQTEFVKRAYDNSVAESQKIRELHRKLARQTFEPFGNLVGKTPETHNKP